MSCGTSDRRFPLRALALVLLCQLLAACGSLKMDLPSEFLRLEDGPDHRAVTAQDARVWVREFDEANHATVEFWAATLRNDLEEQRGYTIVAEGEATDGDGHNGRWFECRAIVEGERYGHLVAVFSFDRGVLKKRHRVRTVQFTAREEDFARLLPDVKAALGTLRR